MNMKHNNSKVARVLRRLLGEELGATMMEYVILAVMIAAAVTAAAIYFGNSTKNQMQVANDAMVGDVTEAEARAGSSMDQKDIGVERANASARKFKKIDTDTDAK